MIKVGKLGTEPLLESLSDLIEQWLEDGLIVIDSYSVVSDMVTGDGSIRIVLHDSSDRTGNK